MFYGATPSVFQKAKELRNNMTPAENALWNRLSKNQLKGFRFRRQHPLYLFIADFYCHKATLVVEIDGGIHSLPENKEYDINRDFVMQKFGIQVLRFTNEEVLNNVDKVLNKIESVLIKTPSPTLPEGGE